MSDDQSWNWNRPISISASSKKTFCWYRFWVFVCGAAADWFCRKPRHNLIQMYWLCSPTAASICTVRSVFEQHSNFLALWQPTSSWLHCITCTKRINIKSKMSPHHSVFYPSTGSQPAAPLISAPVFTVYKRRSTARWYWLNQMLHLLSTDVEMLTYLEINQEIFDNSKYFSETLIIDVDLTAQKNVLLNFPFNSIFCTALFLALKGLGAWFVKN